MVILHTLNTCNCQTTPNRKTVLATLYDPLYSSRFVEDMSRFPCVYSKYFGKQCCLFSPDASPQQIFDIFMPFGKGLVLNSAYNAQKTTAVPKVSWVMYTKNDIISVD